MDRFDALQAFARVVEAGSFTKAAQTLHMSKTTVTQLVQQLEARLRVKLLHRTTRQVRVTADGAASYERVARLLADLEDADTSLSSASASPKGRLRVDVPSPLARMILVLALPSFHARYPEIQLDLGAARRYRSPCNATASVCRCRAATWWLSMTETPTPCRCIWLSRRAGTSAPSCGSSSIGWPS